MKHAPVRCELVTWAQVQRLCLKLAEQIEASGFRPEAIVAIGRGGWTPARLLSDYLDVFDLTSFKIEHYRGVERQREARVRYPLAADLSGLRVLVVDDVSDSGETFVVALDHVRSRGEPAEIRTAALHHKVVASYEPDYYAKRIVKWRWLTYPWAVIEDASGFIARMPERPGNVEEARAWLAKEHNLRLRAELVERAMAIAARGKAV
jgi:hypoxanthine phosphoribosyltransferase